MSISNGSHQQHRHRCTADKEQKKHETARHVNGKRKIYLNDNNNNNGQPGHSFSVWNEQRREQTSSCFKKEASHQWIQASRRVDDNGNRTAEVSQQQQPKLLRTKACGMQVYSEEAGQDEMEKASNGLLPEQIPIAASEIILPVGYMDKQTNKQRDRQSNKHLL